MKTVRSKARRNFTRGLTAIGFVFAFLVASGCDGLVPDSVVWSVRDSNVETKLVVTENGAVAASGPVQSVSRQSFDLAGATFQVSNKTVIMDESGVSLSLSDLDVGILLKVNGTQLDDSSFEALVAKVTK